MPFPSLLELVQLQLFCDQCNRYLRRPQLRRMWWNTGVIASGQDVQQGTVKVFLYVPSVIEHLDNARICQGTTTSVYNM